MSTYFIFITFKVNKKKGCIYITKKIIFGLINEDQSMEFRTFVLELTDDELEEYANNSGTTVGYLKTHLLYGYKEPRRALRKALVKNSNGKVSELELMRHFASYSIGNVDNQNSNTATL